MKVSVVIPTKNRVEDLKKCVECLVNQTVLPYELIVVDGSDSDETKEYLKNLKLKFKCIYIKQHKGGTANARNLGIKKATGDIIVFMDDDVILDRDAIKEVVNVFAENEEVAGASGIIIEPLTKKNFLAILEYIFAIIFLRDSLRKGSVTASGHHARFPKKPSYVEWLGTSFAAYRGDVLKEFNLDENLERLSNYAYYEDFDISYRISKKYKLFINPRAKAIHRHSPSSRSDFFKVNSVKIQNHYYLVKKHGFSKVAFWWSTSGLLLARVIFLLMEPSRINYMALAGLIDGVKKIIRGEVKIAKS